MKKALYYFFFFSAVFGQGDFSNDFTFGIIGDSQHLTHGWNSRDPDDQKRRFRALTQWFKDHVDSLNIIFISHVGDVVNNEDQPSQWDAAIEAMTSIREAGIPWGIAPGNHDDMDNYSYYNNAFGLDWWEGNQWFGGSYPAGKSQNQYQLFSFGLNEFLWLHLENRAPLDAVEWGQSVLDQFPNRIAFVTTHDYTSERGFETYGESLWNNLIKINTNIIAVFCGHQFGVSYILRENDAGRPVHNILVDFQNEVQELQGATRWMEYNMEENKFYSYTITPGEDNLLYTDPIRPNSFTGWERDLWQANPELAHHETRFETGDFFGEPLLPPVTVRRERIMGYHPPEDRKTTFFDVRGRKRRDVLDLPYNNETSYKAKTTGVYLVQFKDGGKRIVFGKQSVLVE